LLGRSQQIKRLHLCFFWALRNIHYYCFHCLQEPHLQLIIATKQVLQNGLGLLGVSAPEKM
jgi:hypothetical protein